MSLSITGISCTEVGRARCWENVCNESAQEGHLERSHSPHPITLFQGLSGSNDYCSLVCVVRDRIRTKMERDILAEVQHPFIVKLEYGECHGHPPPPPPFPPPPPPPFFVIGVFVCSIPDGGEVVSCVGVPARRRFVHKTLQRGRRKLPVYLTPLLLLLLLPLILFLLPFTSSSFVSPSLPSSSSSSSSPSGDVHRRGCQVLLG